MSALADLSAALLPPEAGGPEPEQVAARARYLIDRMPAAMRVGVGAALTGIEVAAMARLGQPLGAADPSRRAGLLAGIAASGSARAMGVEALKSIVLLAAGAERFAGEMFATGTALAPVREDPELDVRDASEWPEAARCDVVVVGSGAGGAFAARTLARAGRAVVIVEEGQYWPVERLRRSHPLERFAGLYRAGGASFALGTPPIALPLGSAVGGTTVVNSGTCYRPPRHVVERWARKDGLRLADPSALDERLDDVEATLGVAPVPSDVMGRNGELALEGAAKLDWDAAPLRRNAPGCRGACQCAIGCPNNAKAGVHLNALPQACAAGARIVARARAEAITVDDGRARGIILRRADGSRAEIRAPLVVVACGATETPALLRRSGIGRHPRLGRNLSIHPALGGAGTFAEPVLAWRGVLQSAGVEELHIAEGILIEATSTPPGMGSMAIPGLGAELVGRLEEAPHRATLGAMIADAPSGRVVGSRRPTVLYRLAPRDRRRLRRALGAIARLLLAAGAESVEVGGDAPLIRHPHEIDATVERVDFRRLHLAAFHPTGTAAAGTDPKRHPVDPQGRLRGVEGVLVADASIVPSCPGVNPQLVIMALAAGAAEVAVR